VVKALTELLLEAQHTPPMAIAFLIVVDTMMLYYYYKYSYSYYNIAAMFFAILPDFALA